MSSSGPNPSSTSKMSMDFIPTFLTKPKDPFRNMPVMDEADKPKDPYFYLTKNVDLTDADKDGKKYDQPMALTLRPKIGNTTGRPHPIQINSYPVTSLPAKIIYQYDVSSNSSHQHDNSPTFLI